MNKKMQLLFLACVPSVAVFVVYMFFAIGNTPQGTGAPTPASTHRTRGKCTRWRTLRMPLERHRGHGI